MCFMPTAARRAASGTPAPRSVLPRQETFGISATVLNDVEMFAAVGCAVAMGDACEALKAVATHVTGTLEEDGIARALVDLGVLAAWDVGL